MQHLFVVDPLASLQPQADTSIAFMREAARRGHRVCACEVATLRVEPGGTPAAQWVELRVSDEDAWYVPTREGDGPLGDFDVIWMRKDPPYDIEYITTKKANSRVMKSA